MKNILIEKVPDDTWAKLRAQAAIEQKTFGAFMREKLEALSAQTSVKNIDRKKEK